MKAKKVTLLLLVTTISLLTIFLVVLLDDTVLASNDSGDQMLPNLNLYQRSPEGMVATNQTCPETRLWRDEPQLMEAV